MLPSAGYPQRPEEVARSLGVEITGDCELSWVSTGNQTGHSPEEQQVLLPTEPPLQSNKSYF